MPLPNRVLFARMLLRMLAWLPLPLLHAVGHLTGTWLALRPNKYRRTARINLELCFPQLSGAERKRLLRQSLRETAKGLLEVAAFWHWSPQRLDRLVTEVRDGHLLYDPVARRSGVIVAVPHLGAWELLPAYFSRRIPLHSLYQPPRKSEFDPLLRGARERLGGQSYPANAAGIRSLYKALSRGEVAAILPDQEPDGEGEYAPFFGVAAKTMTLLPKLAQRSGATVVYAYAIRLSWGRGYSIRFLPAPPGIDQDDPQLAAGVMNAGIERCVREAPAQYQWSYTRFRRQPDGAANPYKRQPL